MNAEFMLAFEALGIILIVLLVLLVVGVPISYAIGIAFYLLLPIKYSLPAILIFFMVIKFISLLLLQKSDSLTKDIQDKQIIHI